MNACPHGLTQNQNCSHKFLMNTASVRILSFMVENFGSSRTLGANCWCVSLAMTTTEVQLLKQFRGILDRHSIDIGDLPTNQEEFQELLKEWGFKPLQRLLLRKAIHGAVQVAVASCSTQLVPDSEAEARPTWTPSKGLKRACSSFDEVSGAVSPVKKGRLLVVIYRGSKFVIGLCPSTMARNKLDGRRSRCLFSLWLIGCWLDWWVGRPGCLDLLSGMVVCWLG